MPTSLAATSVDLDLGASLTLPEGPIRIGVNNLIKPWGDVLTFRKVENALLFTGSDGLGQLGSLSSSYFNFVLGFDISVIKCWDV